MAKEPSSVFVCVGCGQGVLLCMDLGVAFSEMKFFLAVAMMASSRASFWDSGQGSDLSWAATASAWMAATRLDSSSWLSAVFGEYRVILTGCCLRTKYHLLKV